MGGFFGDKELGDKNIFSKNKKEYYITPQSIVPIFYPHENFPF
jgi:hypothetical protein